jgi:uncharacterized protein (TIGR01777 family)
MRIVIAGGTGLLGSRLAAALRRERHEVTLLTRTVAHGMGRVTWKPDGTVGPWARTLDGAAAIVNLAGESIAGRRWSAARKRALLDSRVLSTRSLVRAMAGMPRAPRTLINASAVGIYGPHGDEIVTEDTPVGDDFLGHLASAWEAETEPAAARGSRVVLLRTGLVLTRQGGMLAKMLPPFRAGLGGPLGTGRQYMPWVHLDDWLSLAIWLLYRDDLDGPFNLAAPSPVTNAEYTHTLARVLQRPAVMRVPAFVLRVALGELSTALLTGQRVVPERALAAGFRFAYPELEAALRHELRS